MNPTSVLKHTVVLLVAALLLPTQPAAAASAKAKSFHPPKQPLQNVSRLAVIAFEGTDGIAAADAIGRRFHLREQDWSNTIGNSITSRKGVEVIERMELDRLLTEQFRSLSGLLDVKTAAQIGKVAGVDALIVGSVTVDLNRGTKEEIEVHYTDSGRAIERKRRRPTLSLAVRIDARILGSQEGNMLATLQGSADTLIVRDKQEELRDTQIWVGNLLESAASKAVAPVFPSGSSYWIPLGDGRTLRAVNSALKDGRPDEACAELAPLLASDPYSPELLYSRGVIHEMHRRYDLALVDYAAAQELKPESKYSDAKARAERLGKDQADLTALGYPVTQGSCPDPESATGGSNSNWYTVKSTRAECREKPDRSLAPAFSLPKKIRVEGIEVRSGWVRARLHDGREVWIEEADLKPGN
jgi:hypothetical protein